MSHFDKTKKFEPLLFSHGHEFSFMHDKESQCNITITTMQAKTAGQPYPWTVSDKKKKKKKKKKGRIKRNELFVANIDFEL